jgi:hypothetical protein
MDGTECGKGLWCVSGYCESMDKRRTNKESILLISVSAGNLSHQFSSSNFAQISIQKQQMQIYLTNGL